MWENLRQKTWLIGQLSKRNRIRKLRSRHRIKALESRNTDSCGWRKWGSMWMQSYFIAAIVHRSSILIKQEMILFRDKFREEEGSQLGIWQHKGRKASWIVRESVLDQVQQRESLLTKVTKEAPGRLFSGWSFVLRTKRSQLWFLVRAHV